MDIDPEIFEYKWQFIRIVDNEKEAQAYFKHTPPFWP